MKAVAYVGSATFRRHDDGDVEIVTDVSPLLMTRDAWTAIVAQLYERDEPFRVEGMPGFTDQGFVAEGGG